MELKNSRRDKLHHLEQEDWVNQFGCHDLELVSQHASTKVYTDKMRVAQAVD